MTELDKAIYRISDRAKLEEAWATSDDQYGKQHAEDCRQLAEWLKELKAYRETYPYGVHEYNVSKVQRNDD